MSSTNADNSGPIENPRYIAYATAHGRSPVDQLAHDRITWPGGSMCGFMLWIRERLQEFSKSNPEAFVVFSVGPNDHSARPHLIDHAAFTAWLTEYAPKAASQRPDLARRLEQANRQCSEISNHLSLYLNPDQKVTMGNGREATIGLLLHACQRGDFTLNDYDTNPTPVGPHGLLAALNLYEANIVQLA